MQCLAFSFTGVLWGLLFWVVMIVMAGCHVVEKATENEEVKNAAKDGLINVLHRWFSK